MNTIQDFVLEKAAGGRFLLPHRFGWRWLIHQELSNHRGAVQIDHRSSRSRSKSAISCSNEYPLTGLRGGGEPSRIFAGVIQPSRTPRSSTDSTLSGSCRGGTISATTRLRSVITTVSPLAAKRTYSLRLFLRGFRPTVVIAAKWSPEASSSNLAPRWSCARLRP